MAKAKAKLPEAALEFFRKQGKRGGKARLANTTESERSAIAQLGAAARWAKAPKRKRAKPAKRSKS